MAILIQWIMNNRNLGATKIITKFKVTCIHLTVQFSHSVVSDSVTPWSAAHQASLSITNSQSLLKLKSIELVMPSNHLLLFHPLLLPPSIFPSIRVFSNVLCIRWPKYWSFSFRISPSNEYSRLISFRMDCLALLAVQGTLKSLLQHHSSKASILQCSAFFVVQLSHSYMTIGNTTSFDWEDRYWQLRAIWEIKLLLILSSYYVLNTQ